MMDSTTRLISCLLLAACALANTVYDLRSCEKSEFTCNNRRCIPHKWICDGQDDCGDKSDESQIACGNKTCTNQEFRCLGTGQCIPISWKCDGQDDCADGSDEYSLYCHRETTCSSANEYTCNNGKCLYKKWVCDGEDDCGDGSDEVNCAPKTCGVEEFTCAGGGKCISKRWRCDGDPDCPDRSDEEGCDIIHSGTHTICGAREWLCRNGHECIPMTWRCDRSVDCSDHSDELNCTYTCRANQFQCHDGTCIPLSMKCNGNFECADGSDEIECVPGITPTPNTVSVLRSSTTASPHSRLASLGVCLAAQFKCASGKCIDFGKVCDQFNDCGDWSDEPKDCSVNECLGSEHGCSQKCVDDLSGYHCECHKGYRLAADNKTCEDVDECAIFGACSGHICMNSVGGYKCDCYPGYEVYAHKYCKIKNGERPYLVFANRRDIRILDLSSNQHQHYNQLYSDLRSTIAIDYSLRGNFLIWSDVAEEKIYIGPLHENKTSFHGITKPQVLIPNDIMTADGIAVDWIHNLLYWTDTGKNTIEIASIGKPNYRKVLINTNLDEPRAIVVNVVDSFLVWTDWGDMAKIEKAQPDGSQRQVLVRDGLVWPNGLAIDYMTRRIYWLDARLHTLSSVDYNGGDRRLVLYSPMYIQHPFALEIFEDNAYWSDWELEAVLRTNKFGPEASKVDTLVGKVFSVMDVRIIHSYKQPNVTNRCHHAACSHICVPMGQVLHRCLCPVDLVLDVDKNTCKLLTPSSTSTLSPTTPHSAGNVVSKAVVLSAAVLRHESQDDSHHEHHNAVYEHVLDGKNVKMPHSRHSDGLLEDRSDGSITVVVVVALLALSVFVVGCALIIVRNYQRRNVTSMNFDNPVYRKTTEEQFALEKSSESSLNGSFPSSLEPLTSPGTNEFV